MDTDLPIFTDTQGQMHLRHVEIQDSDEAKVAYSASVLEALKLRKRSADPLLQVIDGTASPSASASEVCSCLGAPESESGTVCQRNKKKSE